MSSSTIASQNYSIAAFSLEVRSLVFYFIITHLIILLIAGNGKMDNHFLKALCPTMFFIRSCPPAPPIVSDREQVLEKSNPLSIYGCRTAMSYATISHKGCPTSQIYSVFSAQQRSPQFFVSVTAGFSLFYCCIKNYDLAPLNCH